MSGVFSSDSALVGQEAVNWFSSGLREGPAAVDLYLAAIGNLLHRDPTAVDFYSVPEEEWSARSLIIGVNLPIDSEESWDSIDQVLKRVESDLDLVSSEDGNQRKNLRRAASRVSIVLLGNADDEAAVLRLANDAADLPAHIREND